MQHDAGVSACKAVSMRCTTDCLKVVPDMRATIDFISTYVYTAPLDIGGQLHGATREYEVADVAGSSSSSSSSEQVNVVSSPASSSSTPVLISWRYASGFSSLGTESQPCARHITRHSRILSGRESSPFHSCNIAQRVRTCPWTDRRPLFPPLVLCRRWLTMSLSDNDRAPMWSLQDRWKSHGGPQAPLAVHQLSLHAS